LWGLATDGQTGILKAIEILRQELDTSMALLGVTKLHQLKGRACLEP
jgi:isopentenyl diphosphate isomerase/L-lactate dehydrogenase-like FMN-dependent dehydrogenase